MNDTASNAAGYPTTPTVDKGELPDLFLKPDGARVSSPDEWAARARAWRDQVVALEYGGLPPVPDKVEVESLCHSAVRRWPETPRLWTFRASCSGGEKPFSFTYRLLLPLGDGPFPTIINGDGCWWYITEDIAQAVTSRGYGLAVFNRTEMAEDLGYGEVRDKHKRRGGLYDIYPGLRFGALSAWAWGFHRCVDALLREPLVDGERLAVTGHSRGGKTALLAGVTDERIALINDNASCAGGSACYRYVGDAGETLNIVNTFPSWFGPDIRPYFEREETLPFDQHCLLAAAAPRALLVTYATDDRWSNPEGMVLCMEAAREAWRYLGVPDRLAYHLRPGPHAHRPEDWKVLLDYADAQWRGAPAPARLNAHPYRHLRPAHTWRAP